MRLVAFCDTLVHLPRFRAAFVRRSGGSDELFFLICNNGRRPVWLFLAIQFAHATRRYGLRDWIDLAVGLWTRRVRISLSPLGSPGSLDFLRDVRPDVGLHAMGVIYRTSVIDLCGMGILNAHIGRLPEFRGRSVMEWSILCGQPTGVTVFFIDSGIDTGARIVHWEPVAVQHARTVAQAKAYLFSQDAELYRKAVDKIAAGVASEANDVTQGCRFYEMSSLLGLVVQTRLSQPADRES